MCDGIDVDQVQCVFVQLQVFVGGFVLVVFMYVLVQFDYVFGVGYDECLGMFGYCWCIGIGCCFDDNVVCFGCFGIDGIDVGVVFGNYVQVRGCIYYVCVYVVIVYDDGYWQMLLYQFDYVFFSWFGIGIDQLKVMQDFNCLWCQVDIGDDYYFFFDGDYSDFFLVSMLFLCSVFFSQVGCSGLLLWILVRCLVLLVIFLVVVVSSDVVFLCLIIIMLLVLFMIRLFGCMVVLFIEIGQFMWLVMFLVGLFGLVFMVQIGKLMVWMVLVLCIELQMMMLVRLLVLYCDIMILFISVQVLLFLLLMISMLFGLVMVMVVWIIRLLLGCIFIVMVGLVMCMEGDSGVMWLYRVL